MIKVLLLYSFENHSGLLNTLAFNLADNGIEADSLNISDLKFRSIAGNKEPVILKLLKPFLGVPFLKRSARFLFQKRIILDLARHYPVIDIHFLSPVFHELIPRLKEAGKKIKVTIWGTDFYRISPERIEMQRKVYQSVDIIQAGTPQMKADFLVEFPENESRIRLAHFGVKKFDLIEELDKDGWRSMYREELGISPGMITVACGYNGSRVQQHRIIIDAVAALPRELKQTVYLIFQMSYGTPEGYADELGRELKKSGIKYSLFTTPLDDNDTAKLRLSTDIAVNIQLSDAFSASLQEQIFAGSVVIAGNWLPYSLLTQKGIYFIQTGIETLTGVIEECLTDFERHKDRCPGNREKISGISSWNSSVNDWVHNYRELADG